MARADLDRVEKARKQLVDAQDRLHEAIIAAVKSGETYRDVGARAGLSHQRVAQIVRGQ